MLGSIDELDLCTNLLFDYGEAIMLKGGTD
jgi:hypothetical protein